MLKNTLISALLAAMPFAALATCATNWAAAAPGDLLATHVEDLGGADTFNALKTKKDVLFVVGTTDAGGYEDMVVAKYRADGACGLELDPGFNSGTPIVFDFDLDPNVPYNNNSGVWIDVRRIDTDNDGVKDDHEIYAGGPTEVGQGAFDLSGVAKFLSDGSPDLSYGGGPVGGASPAPGSTVLACSAERDLVADGYVNSQGEAVIAGQSVHGWGIFGLNFDFYSAKVDAAGDPSTWGTGLIASGCAVELYGGEQVAQGGYDAHEFAVSTMDFDGKVLSVGGASFVNSGNDIQLIRYLSDGTYDPTFGVGGVAITVALGLGQPGYYLTAVDAALVKLFAMRRIVVVGRGVDWAAAANGSAADMFIIRYLEDGSVDTAFGANGFVRSDLGLTNIQPKAVAIDRWKRTIVVGNYGTAQNNGMFIARYDIFGNLDMNFGVNGVATTSGDENVVELGITSDGKNILVVGNTGIVGDAFVYLFKG